MILNPEEQRAADIREFRRRKALFEPLLEHPGWKELVAIATVQKNTNIALLLKLAPSGSDGIMSMAEDHYRKGIAFAIDMVLGTPAATIQTANELIRQEEEQTNAERFNLQPGQPVERKQPDLFDDNNERLGPDTVVTDLSGSE